MSLRHVVTTVKGRAAVDGAGVHLVRVLGYSTIKLFDPFLMLDAFDSIDPNDYLAGFPMHPHRGIETVTYLLEGRIDHRDSLGNSGSIQDGCCQWMTAGSGIMHEEMPQRSQRMLGLQLWINLPTGAKMAQPKYHGLDQADIPVARHKDATVRVLSGRYEHLSGVMEDEYVKVTFLDITLQPDAIWHWTPPAGDTVFAYIFSGSIHNADENTELPRHEAVLFSEAGGIQLHAGYDGARLVMVSGAPLHEPVAWGGPIVMNTEPELQQAFYELQHDTFIKHSAEGQR